MIFEILYFFIVNYFSPPKCVCENYFIFFFKTRTFLGDYVNPLLNNIYSLPMDRMSSDSSYTPEYFLLTLINIINCSFFKWKMLSQRNDF